MPVNTTTYIPELEKRLGEKQAEIDSHQRTVKEEYGKREALEAEIERLKEQLADKEIEINVLLSELGE